MTQKHKHYDVIVAWSEGRTVQYKALSTGRWSDILASGPCPMFSPSREYRIKPEIVRYRTALMSYPSIRGDIKYVMHVCTEEEERRESREEWSAFVRWVGGWQEVDV